MKIPRPKPVFHPFLFATYPILFLYQYNRDEVTIADVIGPLWMALAAVAALLAVFFAVFRNVWKAAAAVTVVAILFFSYGHVRHALEEVRIVGIDVGRNRYVLPLWGLLGVGALVLIARSGTRLPQFSKVLNLVAAGLVITSLASIAFTYVPAGGTAAAAVGEVDIRTPGTASRKPRDIYYLVFDRYAGERTLREIYGFDNTPFLSYLRSKGFYVASESRANYINTVLSLTSSLNMKYLDELSAGRGDHWRPAWKMLWNNRVIRFLKKRGYRYTHLGSWWEPTRKNPNADRNLSRSSLSEFSKVLLDTTALDTLDDGGKLGRRTEHRAIPLYQFEKLAQTRSLNQNGPDFVFAHVLLPHPPAVFDRNGNAISVARERKLGRTVSYREQLVFTNQKIRELIDILLSGPEETHPIIVLAADEGPYPDRWEEDKPARHQKAAAPNKTDAELRMKFRILNSYYLPGGDTSALSPSIGPVNSFRVILNQYFGADLPLLPERSYVFKDFDHRFTFEDVTKRFREPRG